MDIVQETLRHLRRTKPHLYELTEPHLLYLTENGAKYFTTGKEENRPYANGFIKEIADLMKEHKRHFLTGDHLELVEWGPGEFPDQTGMVLVSAVAAGMKITYGEVDISTYYLDKNEEAVHTFGHGINIKKFHMRFENVTAAMIAENGFKAPLIYVGPNYMSYRPAEIGAIMKRTMGAESRVIVASELLTPANNCEAIRSRYDNAGMKRFGFGPLQNLGCSFNRFDVTIDYNQADKRVETTNKCRRNDGPFIAHDTIKTAVSYRTDYKGFESDLGRVFTRGEIFRSKSGHTALAICAL